LAINAEHTELQDVARRFLNSQGNGVRSLGHRWIMSTGGFDPP
jgi:hypothetical protein